MCRRSPCGATGSAASWERWDTGLLPDRRSGLRIQLQLRLQLWLRSDPWPQKPPYAIGWPKKIKNKIEDR